MLFILSIAIPVIEEFHWRIYCMKAMAASNEVNIYKFFIYLKIS